MSAKSVHQLKVMLREIKPPIWRRVQMRSNSSLADLRSVIQAAFGWWDCHLHELEIGGVCYGTDDLAR